MPELTTANIGQVLQACRSKLEAIGKSLSECFDANFRLAAGEPRPVATSTAPADLAGPGVVVAFEVGSSVLLCGISSSLPLPAWYREPNASQIAQLEKLAVEWASHCLPESMSGGNSVSLSVSNLGDCVASAHPVEGAIRLPLLVHSEGTEPAERIWLIWPARRIPTGIDPQPPDGARPAPAPRQSVCGIAPRGRRPGPVDRLRLLPVPIIVKLAEKKIELGHLVAIGPGAIITFEKSCEDLLDLYVNNQLYCRGEAVKIGEKFGIKVCEIGSAEARVSALLAVE
jgi:flagellar motor switch protein FliN/FliY